MPVPPHKKFKRYQDVDEFPLSPDVEWMLQSRQVGSDVIIESLVGEYYRDLVHISQSIVGDSEQARECVNKTLLVAARNAHKYWGKLGVKIWVFNLCVDQCLKIRRKSWIYDLFARSDDPTSLSSSLFTGNTEINLDLEILHVFDNLKLKDRLILMFHFGFDLTAPEIGAVLGSRANKIRSSLHEAKRKFMLKLQKLPGNPQLGEDHIRQIMQKRYIGQHLPKDENKLIVENILVKLRKRESNSMRNTLLQQFLLVTLVIGLVVAISWMTNVFAAGPARSAVVETVFVTKVVRVTPDQPENAVETKQDVHGILSQESSVDDILVRMRSFQSSWKTLWLDGRVNDFGPPGYTGAPLTRQEQVWVSQPSISLVLSGWEGGDVDQIRFATNGKVYDVDSETGRQLLYDFQPNMLPVYSYFEDLIFPSRGELESQYEVKGSDQISGRDSIILDGYDKENNRRERIWVDAITGIVLRRLDFASDGEAVIFEVVVRQIFLDVSFPRNFFYRNNLVKHFSSNYFGEPSLISEESSIPWQTPAPGHEAFPHAKPPEGFDPSLSALRFQWSQPSTHKMKSYESPFPVNVNSGQHTQVSVYADIYFLGEMSFNPWLASCDRSTDGETIAISSVYGDLDSFEYSIQVVNLVDVKDVSELSLDARPMDLTIAMNPRTEQLAYFGCQPNAGSMLCGIYLVDLHTLIETFVYPSNNVQRLFWSPDGRYLAVAIYDPARQDALVIDIEKEQLVYSGNYDFQNDLFPRDAPVHDWDIVIDHGGLEACLYP